MILTKGSEPVNFNSLIGKKRLSESYKVFQAKVSRFLNSSLEKTIELAKRTMLNGEFSHELLEAFRHVLSGDWKKHYNADETSELHLSINQHAIALFSADELKLSTLLDLYCCRHTVASLFKTKGANGYVVKTLLGHFPEDEITFGVYAGRAQIPLEVLK